MFGSSFNVGVIFSVQRLIMSAVVLFSLLLLSACGGGVAGDDKNYIIVKDQSVIHLNEVVIETVVADQALLIVVYAENGVLANTESDTVLGFAPVSAGDYQDLVVTLSRDITDNETLFVELRIDKGVVGELDGDPLVVQAVAAVSFGVIKSTDPYIEIWLDATGETFVSTAASSNNKPSVGGDNKYPINGDLRVDLKKVITTAESWLVAYHINADLTLSEIGFQKLNKGHSSDVEIDLSQALLSGDQITVRLHEVNSQTNGITFDDALDVPVIFNESPVQVTFTVP